jgi:ABC-type nitrate/sulfonate/bicarbonate transport system permease component
MNTTMNILLRLLFIALLLALWEAAVRALEIPAFLLPAPSAVGMALPYIFAGLEIAMIFALIGAIVGEFVGAQAGLGMLIQSMNVTMDVAGQFSVLLILSLVGLALNMAVALIRRRVLFWDPGSRQGGSARLNTDAA